MKILSLSYFAEIWPHSYPEFLILKSLNQKYNFEIDYLNCDYFFESCMVHDSRQKSFSDKNTKNKICKLCVNTKKQYLKNSNLKNLTINEYISNSDLSEIKIIIEKLDKDNFINTKVFGIEIVRYTLFNYFISQKKSDLVFSDKEFEKFKIRINDTLKSLYAFKKIIENNKYDYLIAFSTEYSLNRACAELASNYGIKVLSMANGKHTQSKFKFLRISEGLDHGLYFHANEKWNNFEKKSLVNENLEYVGEYITSFLGSKTFMNYSSKFSNQNIRNYFDIGDNFKKIVLVALSSQDERSGDSYSRVRQSENKKCSSQIFNNDIEWCEWLLNKLDRFPDTYFIVRFHPRSFPSQRNKEESDLSKKILKIAGQKKNNLSFNFPSDPLSVYDYIDEIDLLLQSSSSISFEFGLFGIPNLNFDKNLYYFNDDLSFSSNDLKQYLDKIDFLLDSKNYNKKDIIIKAFKWLIIQLNYEFVDISDVYDPPSSNTNKNIFLIYSLKIINKLQKIIGINFITNILIKKFDYPKNIEMFKNIFEKNLNSNLDITLKNQDLNNKNIDIEFEVCKKFMIDTLKDFPSLKRFYKKI